MEQENEDVKKLARMIRITCYSPKFAKDKVLDKETRREIEYRKKCSKVSANEQANIPCSEEPSCGCNSTPSFTIIPYITENQYIPIPKAIVSDITEAPVTDKSDIEQVDDDWVPVVVVVTAVIAAIAVLAVLARYFDKMPCLRKKRAFEQSKKQDIEKKTDSSQSLNNQSSQTLNNNREDNDGLTNLIRPECPGKSEEFIAGTEYDQHCETTPKYL